MNRKNFIKTCGFACLGGTAITFMLEGCASTIYFGQSTFNNNIITIKKTEFFNGNEKRKVKRKYILIKTDQFNYPIYVYKLNGDEYSALLMECTHKGCELQPQGSFLVCPCHGSEFTNKGVVQNPPAEQNLKSFIITSDNENLYIQL